MSFITLYTDSVHQKHSECKENVYTFRMSFGKWLVQARERAGLTQRELAQRAGISTTYVSGLEREEPSARDGSPRRPRVEKIDALARALGIQRDEARLAAGYAPAKPFTKPATIEELAPKFLLNIPIHLGDICIAELCREDIPRREVNFHPR